MLVKKKVLAQVQQLWRAKNRTRRCQDLPCYVEGSSADLDVLQILVARDDEIVACADDISPGQRLHSENPPKFGLFVLKSPCLIGLSVPSTRNSTMSYHDVEFFASCSVHHTVLDACRHFHRAWGPHVSRPIIFRNVFLTIFRLSRSERDETLGKTWPCDK